MNLNFTILSRAAVLNAERYDAAQGAQDTPRLIANAGRVARPDVLANWGGGPMSDDQRKAMFARQGGGGGGGGGTSPRQSRWYDKDVLEAAGSGFLEGANNAAEKGLAKMSFGLTDKIGFTDSKRAELQDPIYDAADQGADVARTALIAALGLKAGTIAWNAWKAKQAAAVAATAGKPTLEQAQKTVAELRAAYRHAEADALIKRMGDAWPKYAGKISTPADDLLELQRGQAEATWKSMQEYPGPWDPWGNRASTQARKGKPNMNSTSQPLLFLSNAVSVAHTPDEVLANANRPIGDDQRKAMFAKMGGGPSTGGGGGGGGGGKNWTKTTMQATVAAPSTGGRSYSWSVAAPAGLAEAQAQNAQWLGSQLAAGRTVVPAGGGQITAEGTWTPQGGFVPHSAEVLQAMATTRAQIAFNKQLEQQMFERASAAFKKEMGATGAALERPAVMPRDKGGMVYTGGTPNFDERTGRYIDKTESRSMTMPIRQPSGGQYNRPAVATQPEIPGSTAYLARMNAGTPAGNYYKQLADSGVQWANPSPRLATAGSRAGQSAASRPQYNKQTGQMEYPGGRITTEPTPWKPAAPWVHEKINPVLKRPTMPSASLAKALQRYG